MVNLQPSLVSESENNCRQVSDINYQNNISSSYTEQIKKLNRTFNYADHKNYYWGDPEFSIFYGSPLYEEASPSQKLALNHLYWVAEYEQIAAGESGTIIYNQVTSGVFSALGDRDALCKELELETEQERHHIHAFQKISYKTKTALLGKPKPDPSRLDKTSLKKTKRSLPKAWQPALNYFRKNNASSSAFQYQALRFIAKTMLASQGDYYSKYLQELEQKDEFFPIPTQGYFGIVTPQPLLQFFTFNWGSSPFMACQHYTYRYTGNMVLKNYEHEYFKYFKKLEKKGEFIPTPTAVSYYHLLDESFHTTTSQLIGRDLYKEFPKPTAYEKLIANANIRAMQLNFLNGLCSGIPAVFLSDSFFMPYYYKLLRSPVFNLSPPEALHWMEKCLCREHEGFHVGMKYHQRLLKGLRRFFNNLDYLGSANRDLNLMESRGSINSAIQSNVKAFQQFSQSVVS